MIKPLAITWIAFGGILFGGLAWCMSPSPKPVMVQMVAFLEPPSFLQK